MDSMTNTLAAPVGPCRGPLDSHVYFNTFMPLPLIKDGSPKLYRLRKTLEGEYILQGAFLVSKGYEESWLEWEDLETINE